MKFQELKVGKYYKNPISGHIIEIVSISNYTILVKYKGKAGIRLQSCGEDGRNLGRDDGVS